MATEYINNFITELIATYGIESLSELETMAISAINKEKYLKKTLQPFFISDEFKEEYPYDYMRKEELNKNIDKWNMNLKELLNYINTDYVYFKNKLKIENKTDFNTYSFKKDDYVLYTKRNVKAIIVFVDISSKSFHISIPSLPELGEINTIDKYLKPYWKVFKIDF